MAYCQQRKTQKEFVKEIYNLVGNEYEVLGEYVSNKIKIKMKHNKCNTEFETRPNDFLRGRRCPYCFGTPKKTTEGFKKEIYNLVGNEYEVLGEYKTTNDKIKMKHNKCNTEFEMKPFKFLHQNHRCPNCSKLKKKTTDSFSKEIGDDYELLSNYINCKTKVKLRHKKCNNIYYVEPKSFSSGRRCPYCFGTHLKTTEKFKKEVYDLVKDEYIVISDYINNSSKIKFQHNSNNCNHYIFEMTPTHFLGGNRCPCCNLHNSESKAVKEIKEYLENNYINYIQEKTFSTCKDKYLLRFDFYLTEYDLLIEYDGKQHFEAGWYKDENKLSLTQKHDKMKNDWCKENNKDLLRLSYDEDYIKNLDKYLNENYEIIEE
jgi:very-short-patch-repair endonuclease